MIPIANDDGKKMLERDELQPFLEEYLRITGVQLILIGVGERPDFLCMKGGRRYGLEVVRAMEDPRDRQASVLLTGDHNLNGQDAALMVVETVHRKEAKRASAGWRYPKSTILVVQLFGSDGRAMAAQLDNGSIDEMAKTGFREIWVADYSPMEPYRTVDLIGIKPKRFRGVHPHGFDGAKPYG